MKNLILILFLGPLFAIAQKTHTVGARESLFSIGRLYNIHPRDLASYNNISFETGLTIGQVLKIPAKGTLPVPPSTSPSASNNTATVPAKTVAVADKPVYHRVGKKETLYSISVQYGKVPIEDIKRWNNLSGDGLKEGMNLIVGYGKVASPVVKTADPEPIITQEPETVKPEPVKTQPVKTEPAKTEIVVQPAVNNPKAPVIRDVISNPVMSKNHNGGIFKSVFSNQASKGKEEKGTGGSFKSTSGWEDGKYYCLHNFAPTGSIIRITSPATNKTVYAKVLDVIPDLKQNEGLSVVLSNAAAEELGVSASPKFECIINY